MKVSWMAVALAAGSTALAQYTPGSRPQSYSAGNVLYPGGAPPQAPAGTPAAPYGGYGQRKNAPHQPHAKGVIVPVYFSVGIPEPTPLEQPPQGPTEPPAVIVNQAYRPEMLNPVLHDYSDSRLPEPPPPPAPIPPADPSPTIYLIALKDGSIMASLSYWMDGDTLNYIARDGNRNRVSIDRVDREFSVKLNADRMVEFKLP